MAELDAALETVRLELTQSESAATATREQAHARELAIERRQQQITFDKQQIEDLARQAAAHEAEAADLEARRDPARLAIEAQRLAAAKARQALDEIRQTVDAREDDYRRALTKVQAAEGDADHTRAAVLSATSTLAALRQARDHAEAVRARVAADREKLDLEFRELEGQLDRASQERAGAEAALDAAKRALAEAHADRVVAEAELAARRSARERIGADLLDRQRDHAGAEARLRSLEELDASRATFGDAARFLLTAGDAAPRRHGAVADHLRVDRSYERAVDALLGDLLQHVVVDHAVDADRALALVAEANAGRCGLVVLDGGSGALATATAAAPAGARTLQSVVHATGAHAAVLERLIGDAWIADSPETARDLARTAPVSVATLGGEIWRGPHRLEGGARAERRGILETRAEVVTLREQVVAGLAEIERLHAEATALDVAIHELDARAAGHAAAEHDHEKAIVGREGDTSRIGADVARLDQRRIVVSTERSQAAEAEQAAGRRREEAALAIEMRETEQRGAEQTLADVLATLQTAREVAEAAMRSVSEARAEQAALVERTSALDVEAMRLEEAARELADRIAARRQDIAATVTRRESLAAGIRESEQLLDADVRDLGSAARRRASGRRAGRRAARRLQRARARDPRRASRPGVHPRRRHAVRGGERPCGLRPGASGPGLSRRA